MASKPLPKLSLLSNADSDRQTHERSSYDVILEDDNHHTTTLNLELSTFWPPLFFFFTAGLLSRAVDFTMISKIDDFDQIYSGYMYRYLVLSPNYLTIPLTFLFVKFMARFSLQKRMLTCAIMATIGLTLVFKLVPFVPGKLVSYCVLFLIYGAAFTMQTSLQGYALGMLCFCEGYLTIVFFLGQSSYNMVLMSMKLIMNHYEVPFDLEAWVIIAWISLSCLGFIISSYYLSKTLLVEEVEAKSQASSQGGQLNYKDAFFCVKWLLLQVVSIVAVNTTVFPGIIFGLGPVTVMSQRTYVNMTNFLLAIIYIVGRPVSRFEFNKVLVKVNIFNGFFIALFLLVCYLYSANLQYEGLCYSNMIIAAYMIFRASSGLTFLSILAGRISTDKNKQAIGQLMSNTIVGSRGLGNIISIFITYILNMYR